MASPDRTLYGVEDSNEPSAEKLGRGGEKRSEKYIGEPRLTEKIR